MSHNVHPYAHRLGILRDWQSRWFGARGEYRQYLKADILIREYLERELRGLYVQSIDIERGANRYRIAIRTARPGMVIGRSGEGTTRLKAGIEKKLARIGVPAPKEFKLDIEEVRAPERYAAIVGQMVAEGLEKRLPFRRVIKQTLQKVMANRDVKGCKIALSGRLGGAEMGRKEHVKEGRIPLQTFRADVDFAREKAYLPYGTIGIKVWIYRGDVFEEPKTKKHTF